MIVNFTEILDSLAELLKKPNISNEEQSYLIDKMIEVANKISNKDSENKEFWQKALTTVGWVALGVVAIGAGFLLGGGSSNTDNNTNNNDNDRNRYWID